MIRKILVAAALLLAPLSLTPASAANLSVKDGAGATQTLCAITMSDTSLSECNILVDTTGAKINPATKEGVAAVATALGSPFQAGGSIGNTAFGISGSLPAGTNAIGTVAVTALPALPTGVNSIGSIANITGTVPLPTGAATQTTLASILTALGSPAQAGGSIANITGTVSLPTGAATSALQTTGNTSLAAIATALGAPAQAGGKIDTVITGAATDIGASVAAATATQLAAVNASRRGFALQNQTTGNCFLNATGTATQDYHSLLIASGAYYESKDSHVGTAALSVICASAGGVYGRQW